MVHLRLPLATWLNQKQMSQNSGFLVHRLADTFSMFWGLSQNPGFLVHRLADSKATISDFWYIDWRIHLPLLKSGSSTWPICSPRALSAWRIVSPDSIRGRYHSAKCDVPSCRGGAGAEPPLPRASNFKRVKNWRARGCAKTMRHWHIIFPPKCHDQNQAAPCSSRP